MAKMYTCLYGTRGIPNVRNSRWNVSEEDIYGSWKITECESSASFDNCDLNGIEFVLDEAGDVRWKLHHTSSDCLPFLTCDSYEFTACPNFKYKDCDQGSLGFKLDLLGSETGELVRFLLTLSVDKTVMTMRYQYSSMLILKCKKVRDNAHPQGSLAAYSLLPALQNGLFSDVTITANNGRQFQAHKAILLCACPTVDWTKTPPPLTNWPPDAVDVTLHYFYSGCLPSNVQEGTVEKIHTLLEHHKGMKNLHKICAQFLESTALKKKIENLLDRICSVVDETYDLLNDTKNKPSDRCAHGKGLCKPENLLAAAKKIIRYLALAFAWFALFCETFTKYKNEMSRDERHKIIKSIKSRLLAMEDKLKQCGEIILECLSYLTVEEQKDLARFFVPEVDHAVEVGTKLAMNSKDALDQIVQSSDHEYRKKPKKKVGMKLSKALQMSIFSKEIQLLKKLQERAASGYVFFLQRREDFNSLPPDGKATLIYNCMQFLITHGAEKLDEFTLNVPEHKFSLKGWKAFTKLVTSKLTWLISKMKSHKKIIEPILLELCELVDQDEFLSVLEELQLMKPRQEKSHDNTMPDLSKVSQLYNTPKNKGPCAKNSSTQSSSNCPNVGDSVLSKSMGALLQTGQFADMTFVICENSTDGTTTTTTTTTTESVSLERNNSLPAHRIVVASRCDWFRRALTSGMKESIDRKIQVYDTDKESFQEFMKYIYTGAVNTDTKSVENLVELLALSDRYEVDNLKAICEMSLVQHFKKDNIFELLVLADQFNAAILKCNALSFIKERRQLHFTKAFGRIPEVLQQEILQQFEKDLDQGVMYVDAVSSSSGSDFEDDHYFPSKRIAATFSNVRLSDSESSEEEYIPEVASLPETLNLVDQDLLDKCLLALREVLPVDISQERLVEISLAADCDINRALNYFYSQL